MAFDPNNFLYSLARHVVTRSAAMSPAVVIKLDELPRELWIHRAIDNESADLYSVLRIYGGGRMVRDSIARPSVQCLTIGGNAAVAMARGQLMFEMLCLDDLGQPLRMQEIDAYKLAPSGMETDGQYVLVAVDPLQRPGLMSSDDNGRTSVVFNFDVGFRRPSVG